MVLIAPTEVIIVLRDGNPVPRTAQIKAYYY